MDTRTRTDSRPDHEEHAVKNSATAIPASRVPEGDVGGEMAAEDVESNIVRGMD